MADKNYRSAETGEYVTEETAAENPRTTLGENEPHEGSNRRDRSAITGNFVEPETSRRHPDTTVTENG
ncbi:hypothetical protein NBRGN_057_03200 [Nocardia brasiliensis NBRC 14402]|uniref:hypothetical protein n=1 Tax=Nocardia brasiliensis TaxID=37326 RepID=UPI0003137F5F|nr:hypothetical protein [Nocardia brasiliensis]ASF13467.1 hypothetical protein CEQ30_35080 [Nocardia brasiliensis]GAJ82813.1 hypothetical protein NBRGN_057_03200 [Nocardia brasiliensis NBRC 14402]SUB09491.1 Uncharacterised protein [Nocardia brasiliensis]